MNVAEIAKRAAVRKVVYVLVALALAWVGIGRAEAAQCELYNDQCSRAEAYAACEASKDYTVQRSIANGGTGAVTKDCTNVHGANGPNAGYYTCQVQYSNTLKACYIPNTSVQISNHYYTSSDCPAGEIWSDAINGCYSQQECQSKPPLGSTLVKGGAFTACSGGCAFEPTAPLTIAVGEGSAAFTVSSGWEPTGAACQASPETPAPSEQPQECTPAGDGQTMCVKPNGDHCYSAGTGRQICWKPGEVGKKTDQNIEQNRDPGNQPQPPVPPNNGDTLVQEGQPVTTTTVTSDGRTITTTTTNYSTGSGADAGSGNSGQPGDGSGEGEGEDDEDNGGEVGGGVGDLYEGDDKTVQSVITDFHNRMKGSPLIGAATGFFAVQGGGSCPTFNFSMFGQSTTIDFFCMAEFTQVFYWLGWFVLAMFTWKAFEVGFG